MSKWKNTKKLLVSTCFLIFTNNLNTTSVFLNLTKEYKQIVHSIHLL